MAQHEPLFPRGSTVGVPLASALIISVISIAQWWGPLSFLQNIFVLRAGFPGEAVNWPGLFLHLFSHAGWTHLLLNMVGLVAFGAGVVRGWGVTGFILAMAGGALMGGGAEVIFADQPTLMAGASTGVSAVFALALLLINRRASLLRRVLLIAGFVAIVALMDVIINVTGILGGNQVAMLGHAGGFLFGGLMGLSISPKPDNPWAGASQARYGAPVSDHDGDADDDRGRDDQKGPQGPSGPTLH